MTHQTHGRETRALYYGIHRPLGIGNVPKLTYITRQGPTHLAEGDEAAGNALLVASVRRRRQRRLGVNEICSDLTASHTF